LRRERRERRAPDTGSQYSMAASIAAASRDAPGGAFATRVANGV
jgi:hypothetical protein